MARRQMFDIGGETRLKPLSIRILFTFSNILMLITGITLLFGLGMIPWDKSLLAIVFATIIIIEIGLKRFTSLSSLKQIGLVEWTATFIALMIFVFGIITLFNLATIPSLNQIVGSIFVLSSIITTIDLWF